MNILVDGVIFQLQEDRPGITRVWQSLLPELKAALPGHAIILLRRNGFQSGLTNIDEFIIPAYRMESAVDLDADDAMLSEVCTQLKGDIFLSSYYTRSLSIHNMQLIYDMIPEVMGYDLSRPEWLSKQRAITNASSFVAISRSTRSDLIHICNVSPERVITAYTGVSEKFSPAEDWQIQNFLQKYNIRFPYYMLVGHRAAKYKNYSSFFQALTLIPERNKVQVLVTGGGNSLLPEESKFSLPGQSIVIPRLSDEDLRCAYSGALALVYPSRYEGFGLPVAEAMKCGCPVITSFLSSLPEVGGISVLYINPDSIPEIANALQEVTTPDLRHRLKKLGIEQGIKFTWKAMAETMAEFIQEQIPSAREHRKNIPVLKIQAETIQKPKISVITPSFNQGKFIERTIQSVLAQNYPDFEHIVMDGGSTDGTREILKRYPHLKWKSKKDSGQSEAFNKGLRMAKGEIIAWINSDDWYEPEAFDAVAEFFMSNPDKNIVMGDCNLTDENGNIFDRVINTERDFSIIKNYWIERSIPTQPAIFYRKKLHDEFGGLDETLHYAMDYDLWLRFSSKNRFYHINKTLANYRFHSEAKGGQQDYSKFIPEWQVVYKRYAQVNAPTSLVSVVIPCYNYAQYLPEAVNSVLQQTYQNFEIIIVNDGSTDNSRQVAEQLIADHREHCIRLINQVNSGQPAISRNVGIQAASGEYVLPLDADDMIHPTFLEKCVRVLDDELGIGIVYTDIYNFSTGRTWVDKTGEFTFPLLCERNQLSYCSLYRRLIWSDVGGYKTNVIGYEDWDFWISCIEKGYKGTKIDQPLFLYRVKEGGIFSGAIKGDQKLKAQIVLNHPDLYNQTTVEKAKNIKDNPGFHNQYSGFDETAYVTQYPDVAAAIQSGQCQSGKEHYEKYGRYENRIPNPFILTPASLVSVIIPCYKQANYLPEAVESIVAQTYKNWECIIVNDGSPDETPQVAQSLIHKYPDKKIILVNQDNKGLAEARNSGIRSSHGKYIFPLDADDLIHPETLAKTASILDSDNSTSIVYVGATRFGYINEKLRLVEWDPNELLSNNFLLCSALYRRVVWEKVGGYNPNMTWGDEDWDFYIGALDKGFVGKCLPEYLFYYRTKPGSMITKAQEHDTELKAQIILNHPNLFDDEMIEEAKKIKADPNYHDHLSFFNEAAYVSNYIDVLSAIQAGQFKSGWEHYSKYGRSENRSPNPFVMKSNKFVNKGMPYEIDLPLQLTRQADEYIAQGNLPAARDALQKAMVYSPDDPQFMVKSGNLYLQQGDIESALREFLKSTTVAPNYYMGHSLLGLIYIYQGEYDKAKEALLRAEKINPADQNVKNLLTQLEINNPEKQNAKNNKMVKKQQKEYPRGTK